jgi:ABC-2 type transport system permease protein
VSSAPEPPPAIATPAGSIYDLGYRHYEGARLGRRHAMGALYRESLRGAFGLGRSTASKIAPAVLIAFAVFPALVQVILAALVPLDVDLIQHEDYYELIKYLLALYCAAVAPDICGRDQRNRSLTLYFSRAISRSDYALAKLAAMTTAMLLITLLPQALLFTGNALGTQDVWGYLTSEWTLVLPILVSAFTGSALIASIGTFIAAQTPRRAFATVGIVVAFILPIVVAGILVHEIDTELTRFGVFLSPLDLVGGFTPWIFRAPAEQGSAAAVAGFALWWYALAGIVITLVASALLVRRYQKVQA